eukprot:7801159-Pyramimonas_sp.AAC.1
MYGERKTARGKKLREFLDGLNKTVYVVVPVWGQTLTGGDGCDVSGGGGTICNGTTASYLQSRPRPPSFGRSLGSRRPSLAALATRPGRRRARRQ